MANQYIEEEEYGSQITGKTILRLVDIARPHWRWFVGFLAVMVLVAMLDAFFTFINKRIVDEAIYGADREALYRLATVYGSMISLQALGAFAFIYLTAILGERIRYDMRKAMFNNLQNLSLSYYNQTPVGWIMARVTSDTERVSGLVTWGLLDMTWAIMSVLSAAVFMLIINWRLALIVLAIIPILTVVAVQFRKLILVEFRRARRANSKITGAYNENITGVRVIKALGREDENLREFQGLTTDMFKASFRAAWLSALFLPVVQMISSIALGVIVWYGGLQTQVGALTIGGIQAFVGYVTFMMWPVQDLARVYADMQHAVASAERIFGLIDTVPDVRDRPGAIDPGNVRGEIEFEHVDFYYDDKQDHGLRAHAAGSGDGVSAAVAPKQVLTDFNLKVNAGETIALVGPTGGGKTTIVNLVCRFFEPKRGVIRFSGQDYTSLSLHAIHSRIGVVLQTPHLFSGTIRENLRYGRLNATDEELEEASKIAGAHDFIITLPKGYDEEVGEGGNLLSVGQKQLISLARAVLSRPEIFIMDEATSSVDTLTEALIQRGMHNLLKDCTSFIIAHRLSTIRRADRILVIENGRIAEMGSHAELLRRGGHYYRLYTQQFRHEREVAYEVNDWARRGDLNPPDPVIAHS